MGELPSEKRAVLSRIAQRIVALKMETPAILYLETFRPMNFIASQALLFLSPVISAFFDPRGVNALAEALEEREAIPFLIQEIERIASSEQKEKEKGERG